ncbi:MAG: 4-hydroxythreonine-4-phosphate dehydrogenase PdxA [Bacteroidota bacterium]
MANPNDGTIKVGVSIGDINGIGMEVIIKTFADNRVLQDVTPVVYGSSKIASYYKKNLNLNEFNFHLIRDSAEAQPKKANLVACWEEEVIVNMGQANETGGKYALRSLEAACKDLAAGKIDVLVTAPLNKNMMQSERFKFPGHTEYLANLSNVEEALMMMVGGNLRVGVVTGHIPLSAVSQKITKDRVLKYIRLMNQSLIRDFGVRKPKIAVLGVNPHAGENGLLGEEDRNHIEPAVKQAKQENIVAIGPYAADGLFGSGNFKNFDGILAMYHDQGLAPFKALSFDEGVNFTAGLPVVRTSPDHGTGYDLCGKNIASEASFRNAVYLAKEIFLARKFHKEINANPLQVQVVAEKGE